MSSITDMVFVLPADPDLKDYTVKFEAMVQVYQTFEPRPAESVGSKIPGGAVYFLGVNYLNSQLIDDILANTWPEGTILYTLYEQDEIPRITVFGSSKQHDRSCPAP